MMKVHLYVYEKFADFDGSMVNKLGKQVALICANSKEKAIELMNEKFNGTEHVYSLVDKK
jgi:hypothetical protein